MSVVAMTPLMMHMACQGVKSYRDYFVDGELHPLFDILDYEVHEESKVLEMTFSLLDTFGDCRRLISFIEHKDEASGLNTFMGRLRIGRDDVTYLLARLKKGWV